MTDQEIAGLGPAFAGYLGRFRDCFLRQRTAVHFARISQMARPFRHGVCAFSLQDPALPTTSR
jgi:hypothetical protein